MKVNFCGAVLLLVSSMVCGGLAMATTCPAGAVHYRKANWLALNDFAASAANTAINDTSGRLNISIVNYEVTEVRADGYSSRVTVRSSYFNVTDSGGVKIRETVYLLDTTPNCDDFVIRSVQSDQLLNIGIPDPVLTGALAAALGDYLSDATVLPINPHSGNHSLRVHRPKICANGKSVSVNIVRLNTVSSRIASRTSSYKIDLHSGQVQARSVQPGTTLLSMCK